MPNRLSRRRRAALDTNSDSAVSAASQQKESGPDSESIEGDDNTEPDDSSVEVKGRPRLNFQLGLRRRGKRRSSSPPESPPIPSESEDEEEDGPGSTSAAADSKEPSRKSEFLERLKLRHPWEVTEDGKYEKRSLGLFEQMIVGRKLEKMSAKDDRLKKDAERKAKVQENQMAELVREVDDDSDEELQSIMKPLLRKPAVKARAAETLHAIRRDTKLRIDVSQRLFRDLGDLGNDDDCDVCGGACEFGGPGRPHSSAIGEKLGVGEGSSLSPASQASYSAESARAGRSDGSTSAARFMHWRKMVKQPDLPALYNFEKDRQDMILAGYEAVNFNIGVGGFSLGLDNFLKMIRGFFFKHDIVALWKSNPRSIRVPNSEAGEIGREDLEALERQVLDSEKFLGSGQWLTCLTYNKGTNGSITLFSVEMSPTNKGESRKIRPVAAMDRVPKVILKSIQSRIPSPQRVIVRRKGKYEGELKWTLPVTMQEPQFNSASVNQHHGELPAALQRAFFTVDTAEEIGSVSATVPQMLAALHFSSPILEDVKTGRARFEHDHGLRTVELKKEPVLTYHENEYPQSVVLMPKRGAWVNERILWI